LPGRVRTVKEYMDELERSRKEKPDQVKEALEIYLDLWRKAVKKGVVGPSDPIGEALKKVDSAGGLYKSAGE